MCILPRIHLAFRFGKSDTKTKLGLKFEGEGGRDAAHAPPPKGWRGGRVRTRGHPAGVRIFLLPSHSPACGREQLNPPRLLRWLGEGTVKGDALPPRLDSQFYAR